MPKGIPNNRINKGWFKKGCNGSQGYHWKLSEEILAKRPKGALAPNWKSGLSINNPKEYRRNYNRFWFQNNRDRSRYLCRRRQARKSKAEGSHSYQEWKELKLKFNLKCLMCGRKEPEIKLTEDHIVPLTKGGSDYIENIQPLCFSCNSKKHQKIINFKKQYQYA